MVVAILWFMTMVCVGIFYVLSLILENIIFEADIRRKIAFLKKEEVMRDLDAYVKSQKR
jgi:preprotein translocase subunit SecG